MQLFKRFPKFHPLPREEQQLVPIAERSQYPSFTEDFKTLDRELMPSFCELDDEALNSQNRYRAMYVILIFGGAAVTILGIVQLAFLNTSWIGIIEAVAAALLGFATAWLQAFKYQERYFNARLAAERLRSQYFLFLGRRGEYANEQDRVQKLIEYVVDMKERGEQ